MLIIYNVWRSDREDNGMDEEEFLKRMKEEIRRLRDELEELRFLKYAADRMRDFRRELLREKWD